MNTNIILVIGLALIIVFAFMHFYQVDYYVGGERVRSENPYSAGLLDWLLLSAGIILIVFSEVLRHLANQQKSGYAEELDQTAKEV